MSNAFETKASQPILGLLVRCIGGPDQGKHFRLLDVEVVIGREGECELLSMDPSVSHRHVSMSRTSEERVAFACMSNAPVYLDGNKCASGTLQPTQQLRIGSSLWILDTTKDQPTFSDAFRRVSDSITGAAGLEPVHGSSFRETFSELFRRRSPEELEAVFQEAGGSYTPALLDIDTRWPRPWAFVRIAIFASFIFACLYFTAMVFPNRHLIPALILFGSFAWPLSLLALFFELNMPRNISLFQLIRLFMLGTAISFGVTLLLNANTNLLYHYLGLMAAGPVEETAKLAAVIIAVRRRNYPWILNGLLLGATVGAGFAAFETAGYVSINLLLDVVDAIKGLQDRSRMEHVLLLRGLLTVCGTHALWTGVAAASLWRVRAGKPFEMSMLVDPRFLRTFACVVVLHMIWNAPIQVPFHGHQILVGVAGWILVLAIVQSGRKELITRQEEDIAVRAAMRTPAELLEDAIANAERALQSISSVNSLEAVTNAIREAGTCFALPIPEMPGQDAARITSRREALISLALRLETGVKNLRAWRARYSEPIEALAVFVQLEAASAKVEASMLRLKQLPLPPWVPNGTLKDSEVKGVAEVVHRDLDALTALVEVARKTSPSHRATDAFEEIADLPGELTNVANSIGGASLRFSSPEVRQHRTDEARVVATRAEEALAGLEALGALVRAAHSIAELRVHVEQLVLHDDKLSDEADLSFERQTVRVIPGARYQLPGVGDVRSRLPSGGGLSIHNNQGVVLLHLQGFGDSWTKSKTLGLSGRLVIPDSKSCAETAAELLVRVDELQLNVPLQTVPAGTVWPEWVTLIPAPEFSKDIASLRACLERSRRSSELRFATGRLQTITLDLQEWQDLGLVLDHNAVSAKAAYVAVEKELQDVYNASKMQASGVLRVNVNHFDRFNELQEILPKYRQQMEAHRDLLAKHAAKLSAILLKADSLLRHLPPTYSDKLSVEQLTTGIKDAKSHVAAVLAPR